jgi:hypothetical protein
VNQLQRNVQADKFYRQITLEIGSGEEIIQDINLERIVGKLEFFATDSVHSGVKQFEIKLSGYPDKLNILTGIATASSDTTAFTHLFSPEDIGKINQSHSLLTFIPETGKTMSAKIKSTNHAGQLLRDYHIASVTPEINKIVNDKLVKVYNETTKTLGKENANFSTKFISDIFKNINSCFETFPEELKNQITCERLCFWRTSKN